MTDEDRIRQAARLVAIEFATCDIAAMGYIMGGWTAKQINERLSVGMTLCVRPGLEVCHRRT